MARKIDPAMAMENCRQGNSVSLEDALSYSTHPA